MRKVLVLCSAMIALLPFVGASLIAKSSEVIVKRNRDFHGEALYGYMNGGSDLYLEYGFVSLNVKDLSFEGHEYTIETFKMKDAISAYGIYSIHIFKPLALDTLFAANSLEGFDALSKYQLQGVYGDTYYSIVFNEGAVAAQGAQHLLLEAIKGQEKPETSLIEEFSFLNAIKLPYSGNLKFVKGELALGNVDDSLLEEYATLSPQGLWIYNDEDGKQVVSLANSK